MIRKHLPTNFPRIVCLCGSTRFARAYRDAQRDETLKGNIVLSVGLFGHCEGLDMTGPVKAMLDELHKRKIDMADEILVLNEKIPYCGTCREFRLKEKGCIGEHAFDGTLKAYIGESTRSEIDYALAHNKRVRYLEEP